MNQYDRDEGRSPTSWEMALRKRRWIQVGGNLKGGIVSHGCCIKVVTLRSLIVHHQLRMETTFFLRPQVIVRVTRFGACFQFYNIGVPEIVIGWDRIG